MSVAIYLRRSAAGVIDHEVELLARTGGRRPYRVRFTVGGETRIYGVLGFELVDLTTKKRLDQSVLDALPWRGAGPDPLDARSSPPVAATGVSR